MKLLCVLLFESEIKIYLQYLLNPSEPLKHIRILIDFAEIFTSIYRIFTLQCHWHGGVILLLLLLGLNNHFSKLNFCSSSIFSNGHTYTILSDYPFRVTTVSCQTSRCQWHRGVGHLEDFAHANISSKTKQMRVYKIG